MRCGPKRTRGPVTRSRSRELLLPDATGRERDRHKVPYGATVLVADGSPVKAGKVLATWDPHTRPIITEYGGRGKCDHGEERVTGARQIDYVTVLSTLVVIDPKRRGTAQSKGLRPSVKLIDDKGKEVKLPGSDL